MEMPLKRIHPHIRQISDCKNASYVKSMMDKRIWGICNRKNNNFNCLASFLWLTGETESIMQSTGLSI